VPKNDSLAAYWYAKAENADGGKSVSVSRTGADKRFAAKERRMKNDSLELARIIEEAHGGEASAQYELSKHYKSGAGALKSLLC
jgi:hypothetical protein